MLAKQKPTAQSFSEETRKRFGQDADAILKAYPAASDRGGLESAASLASDIFIGYAHLEMDRDACADRAGAAVYRYSFDRKIPVPAGRKSQRHAGDVAGHRRAPRGRDRVRVRHARLAEGRALGSERSQALGRHDQLLGQLRANRRSERLKGLPNWPRYEREGARVLHLDETILDAPDSLRPRYQAIDAYVQKAREQ